MRDPIERQEVIEIIQSYHGQMPNEVNYRIWEEINELPPAQPEIVRCKDCKWRNVYRFPPKYDERDYCDKLEKTVSADGFCSWGERRTDAED